MLGNNPGAESTTRQTAVDVMLTGLAIAVRTSDRQKVDELTAKASALLAGPPLASSADPEITALRARLLVSTGHREEAQPLIARLAAIGYRNPDYQWTVHEE
jgi:hypothetical protein